MQTRLELIHGNIMEAKVDAIVNPTDIVLSGGGGLDLIIRQAAGEEVDRACEEIRDLYGGCQTGEAVITPAGNLSVKLKLTQFQLHPKTRRRNDLIIRTESKGNTIVYFGDHRGNQRVDRRWRRCRQIRGRRTRL